MFGPTVVFKDRSSALRLRAISMQAASAWRYPPRPVARPLRSTMATPVAALRTMRIITRLPASWRQATHVRTGSRRAFATALPFGVAGLDVDAITGELGREPGVLAVAPDRQRQLRAGHQ